MGMNRRTQQVLVEGSSIITQKDLDTIHASLETLVNRPVEVREVVKEVPVETIKEIPIETIREVQVPVEVIKEVHIEKIVEIGAPPILIDNPSLLPDPSTVKGSVYIAKNAFGAWPIQKPAGAYYSDGVNWL